MGVKQRGSIKSVNSKIMKFVTEDTPKRTEKALYIAMQAGIGYAGLITPVDTSTLINSQYTQTGIEGNNAYGKAGYTANYAAAVHSMTGKLRGKKRTRKGSQGLYWSPNGEPKFLTKGFEENQSEIFRIFANEMKV